MRILQALLRHGQLTPGEMSEALGDVAPATLYRHLKQLLTGGVLKIVEERPVRGVLERVYAVDSDGASLTPDEVRAASMDDHVRYFAVFLAGLLEQFQQYAESADPDVVRDGVGYRHFVVHASDHEFSTLMKKLRAVIDEAVRVPPASDRRRRMLAGIAMPPQPPSSDAG